MWSDVIEASRYKQGTMTALRIPACPHRQQCNIYIKHDHGHKLASTQAICIPAPIIMDDLLYQAM